MTASAALGITVSDTFHYWTCFHRGTCDGLSQSKEVDAHHPCVPAMIQTTCVCACGLIVFRFEHLCAKGAIHATYLAVMVVAVLPGDRIVLPALRAPTKPHLHREELRWGGFPSVVIGV